MTKPLPRRLSIVHVRRLAFLAIIIAACIGAAAQVVGDLRILELRSAVFGNTRRIRVLLPPGYDAAANRDRRYPVLYLNDGQNLFDAATSVFNPMEWKVDESVAALTATHEIQPLIIVGIDSVGRRGRATEYLPFADVYLRPPEPNVRGRNYPRFISDEVMPLINANFRTRTGREFTGIGGSSYGAVAALFAALERPDLFGRLLLESPSLYIGEGKLLDYLRRMRHWPARVYIGVGTNEGARPTCDPADRNSEAVQDVQALADDIARASASTRLRVIVEPCAVHNEDAWSRRFPAAMKFLYSVKITKPSENSAK
ncbi:MAG: alpha/beta hydrolase [Terriglobales bacterium]